MGRIINSILDYIGYVVIKSIHRAVRNQIVRLGLPGLAVSLRAFGRVPSIRNFELIRVVLEIMVINSAGLLN